MKIIGIIFVFISISMIGFEIGNRYISEIKGIKRAENFLKNIILCLENENMTIIEIFKKNMDLCDEKTKIFISKLICDGTSEISEKSINSGFCINKSALSVLEEAFSVLGKYSSEKQIREIGFCRNKLNDLYAQSETVFKSKTKLARTSGILAGIFFSILLI